MVLLDAERKKNEALLLRIRDFEVENERLQRATLQPDVLENQLQQLMNPSRSVYHGPDSVAHFESSIDWGHQ